MGADSRRIIRLLWLAVPLLLAVVWLGGGRSTGAAVEDGAAVAPRSATAETVAFMPVVSAPRPPQVQMVPFATGFMTDTITDIENAGDERLFVVEREGVIRIVYPDGSVNPTPFLDITKDVTSNLNWEQGLLGLAFHPDFPNTPYLYVLYTDIQHIRVARLTLDPTNPNKANPNSMRFMMIIQKPKWDGNPSPVHNGGDLAFGPDGYLYIPLGDGGPDPYVATDVPGDPLNNSQRRDNLFGAILRIDVNETSLVGPDCGEGYYSVPPDNPFIGAASCDEIWATGLRNPWRMDFDPANTNLFIADVGEWKREEINVVNLDSGRGANFGWHCYEGTVDYQALWDAGLFGSYFKDCGPREDYVFPAHEYDHSQGECSLTGGVVYRGQQYPFFHGRYVFADFCSSRLWTLAQDASGQWIVQGMGPMGIPITTFGRDVNGEVYAGVRDLNGQPDGDVTLYKMVVK